MSDLIEFAKMFGADQRDEFLACCSAKRLSAAEVDCTDPRAWAAGCFQLECEAWEAAHPKEAI